MRELRCHPGQGVSNEAMLRVPDVLDAVSGARTARSEKKPCGCVQTP